MVVCALIGRVQHRVVKFAALAHGAHIKLANGEANAVAFVSGAVRVASVGGFRHPDAQIAYRHRNGGEG